MGQFVYVNGEVVRREAARISAFDRSFLYGDGLFETIRAYDGKPFLLAEHLARMAASAEALDLPMPERGRIEAIVGHLIHLNSLTDAYIRVTLSRGTHAGALAPEEPLEPTLIVDAHVLQPYPPERYETGAAVVCSTLAHDSRSPLRRHKTTSYLAGILARMESQTARADEALLLDGRGDVAEGATSNVFCVRGGRLFTPPLEMNILPGITRATVITLARQSGVEVREERFSITQLQSADEAFLTNSLMEVMPVRSVDDVELCHAPGSLTKQLAEAYGQLARPRDR